jgi:Kre9/KNH-like N-terminal Ig-like domain
MEASKRLKQGGAMKKLVRLFVLVLIIAGSLSAASITVTKPALNELWTKGQSFTITWTKTGSMPNNVRVSLRNKASTAVVQEIVDPAPNTGAYLWLVPTSIPDGEYCIRVKVKGADISDDSEVFRITTGQQPPNQPPSPEAAKSEKVLLQTGVEPIPVKPSLVVVRPAENATIRNGEHMYIQFDAFTMPGDAVEIDLYRESGSQRLFNIYYGSFGQGTSAPPVGPDHPRRYMYDWQVPFGDIMSPGYYKIRIHSLGKEIIAWSGRFYMTWPMKEREYIFDAAITNTLCISSTAGLTPPPVRPKCEQLYFPNHAYVGFDVFDYPGSITWTDGEVHQYWRWFIRHARLMFPIEQFQGKKVKLIQAKLVLKKECTVNVNSGLASCAERLFKLDAPLPAATSGDPCLNTQKSAAVFLQNDKAEQELYLTYIVEHWIDGSYPNYGFLLTVADETPPAVAATCISAYTVKLYLKIEEEYYGYN